MGSKIIHINTKSLSSIAGEFDGIKNRLLSANNTKPSQTGGGMSVEQLVSLEEELTAMRGAVLTLIDKTKGFMLQAASDISSQDALLAKNFFVEK